MSKAMSDLILKFKFTDRGSKLVYDVIELATEFCPERNLGQVRIPPDPKLREMRTEIFDRDVLIENLEATIKADSE
jgi:hypothetical protein